jgi:hypothetical protein
MLVEHVPLLNWQQSLADTGGATHALALHTVPADPGVPPFPVQAAELPPPPQTVPSEVVTPAQQTPHSQSERQLPGHALASVPSHASVPSRTLLPQVCGGHVQSE